MEVSGEPGAWVFQRVGRMLVRIPGSTEHPLENSPGDPGHILGLASLCIQLTLTCQPSSTPVYVAESLSQAPACPLPSLGTLTLPGAFRTLPGPSCLHHGPTGPCQLPPILTLHCPWVKLIDPHLPQPPRMPLGSPPLPFPLWKDQGQPPLYTGNIRNHPVQS